MKTGPVLSKEVRDMMAIGLKSAEELHPDFPVEGNGIANTEPSPVSTSLAVAKQGEASEGPERAGHKPLMRNPTANDAASPTGITASDTFPEPPNIFNMAHAFKVVEERILGPRK